MLQEDIWRKIDKEVGFVNDERRSLWRVTRRKCDGWVGYYFRELGLSTLVIQDVDEGKNCRRQERLKYLQQITKDAGCSRYPEMKRLIQ